MLTLHPLVELRTLHQQPRNAFVFMLGNAVFAQAGRAILAVKLLAVENFVPAFTAFDGSVDELKHRLAAQRNAAKKNRPFLNSAARTCGLARFSFSEQWKTSPLVTRIEAFRSIEN